MGESIARGRGRWWVTAWLSRDRLPLTQRVQHQFCMCSHQDWSTTTRQSLLKPLCRLPFKGRHLLFVALSRLLFFPWG